MKAGAATRPCCSDGGESWTNISADLPHNLYVSRVSASFKDTGTVYVSLNGYRWDDFNSYVYKSTNYGANWEKIGNNLPAEPVNVVKEDPINSNVIFAGTDHGLYVSLDAGKTFMGMYKGMPDVPVHDLVIQPGEKDIVLGTHGRSIYIGDVNYVEQLTSSLLAEDLFPLKKTTYRNSWGKKFYTWGEPYEPSMQVVYFSGKNGVANIKIKTENNIVFKEFSDTSSQGLNFVNYDLSIDSNKVDEYMSFIKNKSKTDEDQFKETDTKKTYLHPGKYTLEIEMDGIKKSQPFEIKEPKKRERGSEDHDSNNNFPVNFERD